MIVRGLVKEVVSENESYSKIKVEEEQLSPLEKGELLIIRCNLVVQSLKEKE